METMKRIDCCGCGILLSLLLFVTMSNVGMAEDYTVGGANGGWDQSTDLTSWAAAQTFRTGDNLIFEYTPNHSLLEVSPTDFNSCTTANPLRPPFSGGRTVIPLTTSGSRFFICGTAGHCISGMRVQVNTLADASAPPPSATAPPPPTTSPNRPASSPPQKSTKAPSTTKVKAAASNPALSPAAAAPPSGSLSPAPASSSAAELNVMGALAAACAGFLIMMV